MRDQIGTTQHTAVERIGELHVVASPAWLLSKFATAVASDFDVSIAFTYKPGDFPSGDFPSDDAAEITAIKTDASVHFDGDGIAITAARGSDLLPLFDRHQITALEDRLLARVNAGEFTK